MSSSNDHLKHLLSVPLTPQQLWTNVVQTQRGFLSSPSGPDDAYRKQAATLPARFSDPNFKGAPVGKGYETFAGIQLLDRSGKRVGIGFGFFEGGGFDQHAEAKAIRGLETHAPASVPGGRLMVVVDQIPCPSCRERLVAYARSRAILQIDVWVPERESITHKGQYVSPKQAARSSFQADRPDLRLTRLPSIPVK